MCMLACSGVRWPHHTYLHLFSSSLRWKNELDKLALVRAKFKSAYVFSKQVGDMFIGTDAIELQVRERERERRERVKSWARRAGRGELKAEPLKERESDL